MRRLLVRLVDLLVIVLDTRQLRRGGSKGMTERWSAIKENFLRAVLIRNPILASRVQSVLIRKGVKAAIELEKRLVDERAAASGSEEEDS